MDSLIEHINARVGDPALAVDFGAWSEQMSVVPWTATEEEVNTAERDLGFPLPPFLRRLYLEVNNGSFGPNCGLERVEMLGTLYRHYARVDTQEPNWEWPFGLVPLIGGGGLYFECVYFTDPPYAVVLYDGHECDRDKPLIQSLKPIAPSLEARFEAWLADIKLW